MDTGYLQKNLENAVNSNIFKSFVSGIFPKDHFGQYPFVKFLGCIHSGKLT